MLSSIKHFFKERIVESEDETSLNEHLAVAALLVEVMIIDGDLADAELNTVTKSLGQLLDIEENKRLAEKNQKFDEKFIKLSRDVYKTNDTRAKIKLKINEILGSNIKEVKSHY